MRATPVKGAAPEYTANPTWTGSPLDALDLGLVLIPLDAAKRPLVLWKKFQDAPPSREQVVVWDARFDPDAWATVTGAVSGRFVLDFDGEAGARTLAKLGLRAHVRSGSGGSHVHVAHPGRPVRTVARLDNRWPGLDVKGDGGIATILGSNANGTYGLLRPLGDLEPFESLPQELREAVLASPSRESSNGTRLIGEGERNHELTRIAGSLWARGMSANQLADELHRVNERRCEPPLDEREVGRIARSITTRYERGFPLTDLGNAERLVAEHGDDLRYAPGIGWLVWDGTRWRRDDDGAVVRRAKATVRSMFAELGAEDD